MKWSNRIPTKPIRSLIYFAPRTFFSSRFQPLSIRNWWAILSLLNLSISSFSTALTSSLLLQLLLLKLIFPAVEESLRSANCQPLLPCRMRFRVYLIELLLSSCRDAKSIRSGQRRCVVSVKKKRDPSAASENNCRKNWNLFLKRDSVAYKFIARRRVSRHHVNT